MIESIKAEGIQQLNNTLDTIYSRRSVRKFKSRQVDRESIRMIIDAGKMAPSAMNAQPWKFYVLTEKVTIEAFSKQIRKVTFKGVVRMGAREIIKSAVAMLIHASDIRFFQSDDLIFHGAPVVVFIAVPKENQWAAIDTGACMQNMMLAAKSLGIDSCPIGLAKFVEDTKIYEKLKISSGDRVMIAVIFGYGDETPEVHERKSDNLFFLSE